MNALGFDCTCDILAIGLKTAKGYFEEVIDGGTRHAESLMTEIEKILDQAEIRAADLDLLACAAGPGSFTGLRIAFASAKGICAGGDIPMVSVPSLDYYARPHCAREGLVISLIDARKSRFYAGLYEGGQRLGPFLDLALDELLAQADNYQRVFLTGPDAQLLEESAAARPGWSIDLECRRLKPLHLIELGIETLENRGPDGPDSSPLYVRDSEKDMGITVCARGAGVPYE